MARDLNVQSKIVDSDQYVYRQERDITKTDVDWNTVTKELTDTIEKVRDDRQNQKAEIETATTEAMGQLAEIEKYDSESLNVKVLQGSDWGANFLASQNDLMKRGLIKPSAFMQSKQKVSDSFTQLKKALGTFDADYKEAQKRMNSKVPGEQSTSFEQALMGEMSGLSGLAEWDFSGNPATGNMNFVKKGKDASNPQNLMSLNSINQRLSQKSNYVSLGESSEVEVDRLGAQIQEVFDREGGKGSVIGVEDFLENPDAEEMLNRIVGAVTTTQDGQISIMQDLGVNSDMYSSDPEEVAANPGDGTVANPGMVLMVPTGDGQGTMKPEFSPEQEKLIEEQAMVAVKSQLDKKITALKGHQTVFKPQPSAAGINDQNKKKELAGMYGEVVNLVTGNAAEAEQSATALASYANNNIEDPDLKIRSISRPDGDGVFTVTRADGSTFDVSSQAADGTELSTTDLVDSLYGDLIGESNVALASGAYGETGGVVGDTRGTGVASSNVRNQPIQPMDYQRSIKVDGNDIGPQAYLVSKLQESFDEGDNATAGEIKEAFTTVVDELIRGNDQLTDLGFKIEATDADLGGNDVIGFELPGLPDTGDGPGVRTITGTNSKTIAEAYSEMQAFIDEWIEATNETNKANRSPSGTPAGNVILEETEGSN